MRNDLANTRDSLGTQCAGCEHSNNWHQPGGLCVVKVKQGSDERCGCTYVSPRADQAGTAARPYPSSTAEEATR